MIVSEVLMPINAKKVISITALVFGIDVANIIENDRRWNSAFARHIAMYIARKDLKLPLLAIGRRFQRDHSTVLHAVRNLEERIVNDPVAAEKLRLVRAELASAR